MSSSSSRSSVYKNFLQCEIERKKPALCLLVWISQINLWKKKGPCKVQKFQNNVWALISRGKSPIYFEVLLLLRFANHP